MNINCVGTRIVEGSGSRSSSVVVAGPVDGPGPSLHVGGGEVADVAQLLVNIYHR